MEKAPTLQDLCFRTALDNLHRIGDVGDTDADLLREILLHCKADQLRHIENCTKGRDLTPVTNEQWKNCYRNDFGKESLKSVIEKLKSSGRRFKWRDLYEAKEQNLKEKEKKGVQLLQQLCQEENQKKQSRQIRMCSKLPPDPKRKSWGGSSGPFSHVKGRLMKKARIEHAASSEAKMRHQKKR